MGFLGVCAAAWRRRSHGVARSTAVHCCEHKQYLKHVKRYFKYLPMTNNSAACVGGRRPSVPCRAAAVTQPGSRLGWWRAQPTGAPSLMSVPFAVRRHGSKSRHQEMPGKEDQPEKRHNHQANRRKTHHVRLITFCKGLSEPIAHILKQHNIKRRPKSTTLRNR